MSHAAPTPAATPAAPATEQAETARAVVNAAALALSLGGSWVISLALRLALPRMLGPERFGQLAFADSFAITFLVFSSLGLDTYVRKVVSVDASKAGEFMGGAMVLRSLATGTLVALMVGALRLAGGDAAPVSLVVLAGLAQALLSLNTSLAALMDARGETRRTAPLAVVAKVIYAGGAATALLLGAGLHAVPLSMLAGEAWRCVVLWRRVDVAFPGKWRVDLRAAGRVVIASLPFYLNIVFFSIYGELDLTLIAFGPGRVEAGYYGASNNLAALTLMLMPLLPAIVMPAGSRAAARSLEEHDRLMGAAWRVALLISIPLAVLLVVGARDVVAVVFGADYAPSWKSLVMRAPTVVLGYASTLSAIYLIQMERTWYVTLTSAAGLLVKPALSLVAIAWGHAHLGAGGAGAGAGAASLLTEFLIVVLMMRAGARIPAAAQLRRTLVATGVPCAAAVLVHAVLPLQGLPALLALTATYVAVGRLTGALGLGSVVHVLRLLIRRRTAS
ncbi:MAG: oligosaccharide flippase family protein [Deltaproteobacteria bacterium]|nr:oligosaccharide flippase family protein [Deltaproteobacteria bacterium]